MIVPCNSNGEPADLAILLQEFYYWLGVGQDPGGEVYLGCHVYGASETGWLDDDMSRALYHAYRATEIWLPYLAAQGIKCPPIIFTEAGTEGGWRPRRSAGDTAQDYLRFADKMIRNNHVEAIILYCYEPQDSEWTPWDIAGTQIVDAAKEWNRDHVYRKAIWQGKKEDAMQNPFSDSDKDAYRFWAWECLKALGEGQPSDDPSDPVAFQQMLMNTGRAYNNPKLYGWKGPTGSPSSGVVKAQIQAIRLQLMGAAEGLDNLQVNFP